MIKSLSGVKLHVFAYSAPVSMNGHVSSVQEAANSAMFETVRQTFF